MIYGNNTLKRAIVTNGYDDDNGDWVPGQTTWSNPIMCDVTPSTNEARTIALNDGKRVSYSYEVTMDVDYQSFNVDDKVLLTIEGVEKEFVVKGFHRYFTISKLWV